MSFFVLQSSHANLARGNNESRCYDDLEILNEEDVSVHEEQPPPLESPPALADAHLLPPIIGSSSTPTALLSVHEAKDAGLAGQAQLHAHSHSQFSIRSHSAVIHHGSINNPQLSHVIDHNCTLPQSPSDASSHHDVKHGHHHSKNSSRSNSRRISADPSSLFNLMRMIKGQKFTLYTASVEKKTQSVAFQSQEVFVFYDAHKSRLGSIYWSFQRKPAAAKASSGDTDGDEAANDFGFVRQKLASQSIPLHTVRYVHAGKTDQQAKLLTTSLPATNFFTVVTDRVTLHLAHSTKLVVDQWLLCLKDIFQQHDIECRDANNTGSNDNNVCNENAKSDGLPTMPAKPFVTPLFSAFIDPADEPTDPSLMSLSQARRSISANSHPSTSSSAKLSDSLTKKPNVQPDAMTACGQCVIV